MFTGISYQMVRAASYRFVLAGRRQQLERNTIQEATLQLCRGKIQALHFAFDTMMAISGKKPLEFVLSFFLLFWQRSVFITACVLFDAGGLVSSCVPHSSVSGKRIVQPPADRNGNDGAAVRR